MLLRLRCHPALVFLLAFGAVSPLWLGCNSRTNPKPLTVHVLRDLRSIYGSELDHRILEFQGSNPRLTSGRPISINTVEATDYKSALKNLNGTSDEVQVVILNAPDDAALSPMLEANLSHAVNICAGVRACPAEVPALIPPQIDGEQREAAQKFVDLLQKKP